MKQYRCPCRRGSRDRGRCAGHAPDCRRQFRARGLDRHEGRCGDRAAMPGRSHPSRRRSPRTIPPRVLATVTEPTKTEIDADLGEFGTLIAHRQDRAAKSFEKFAISGGQWPGRVGTPDDKPLGFERALHRLPKHKGLDLVDKPVVRNRVQCASKAGGRLTRARPAPRRPAASPRLGRSVSRSAGDCSGPHRQSAHRPRCRQCRSREFAAWDHEQND